MAMSFTAVVAVVAAVASGQIDYAYPSRHATYLSDTAFVMCVDCPAPTPKRILERQTSRVQVAAAESVAAPMRIDPRSIFRPVSQPAEEPRKIDPPVVIKQQVAALPVKVVKEQARDLKDAAAVSLSDTDATHPVVVEQQPSAPIPPPQEAAPSSPIPSVKPESTPPQTFRETLYFSNKASDLSETENRKLAVIRVALAAAGANAKVTITGYTDSAGSKAYNDRLALQRASSVKNHLKIIDADVSGAGKCCYANPSDNAKNRRVEVKVVSNLADGGRKEKELLK